MHWIYNNENRGQERIPITDPKWLFRGVINFIAISVYVHDTTEVILCTSLGWCYLPTYKKMRKHPFFLCINRLLLGQILK